MTVVVYSTPSCMACKMTKRHLEKLGVPYDEQPLEGDALDQAKAAGITSAPMVLVEGKALWGGYRPDAIEKLVA